MKRLIHSIARAGGVEISRLDQFGRSPHGDIRQIFRGVPLTVIFDVGANEGQTAREYALAYPGAAIHCFEPYDEAYRKLQDLASRNRTLTVNQCALGQTVCTEMLWINSASATNSLLPNSPLADKFQPAGMAHKGTAMVSVSTIDAYCQQSGVDFIDLLKIDTQGYDLRVLQGAGNTLSDGRVPLVFSEVLFAPLYAGQCHFHEIYTFLCARGFRLVNLYSMARDEDSCLSWCDALFANPAVLARRVKEARTAMSV